LEARFAELHAWEQQLTEGKGSLEGLKADAATVMAKAALDTAAMVRGTAEQIQR
jgi:hypothetical protein